MLIGGGGVQHHDFIFDLAVMTVTFKIFPRQYVKNCEGQEVIWQGYWLGVVKKSEEIINFYPIFFVDFKTFIAVCMN